MGDGQTPGRNHRQLEGRAHTEVGALGEDLGDQAEPGTIFQGKVGLADGIERGFAKSFRP
jgi:hypothetical protein